MEENIVNRLIDNLKSINGNKSSDFYDHIKTEYNLEKIDFFLSMIRMCDLGITKVQELNKKSSEKHAETLRKVKINICSLIDINTIIEFSNRFNSLFTDTLFLKIENCADFINDNIELNINEDNISELLKETQGLIDEIKQSALEHNLKKILLLQLSGVYDSLLKYSLFGYEEVELSVKMTIGSIVMNLNKDADEIETSFIAKSLKLMAKFNTTFSFVKNANYLICACMKLLPDMH